MSGPPDGAEPPTPGLRTLATIGSLNALSLLVGLGLGWLVDQGLGTTPIITIVGAALGITVGAYGTYRVLKPHLH